MLSENCIMAVFAAIAFAPPLLLVVSTSFRDACVRACWIAYPAMYAFSTDTRLQVSIYLFGVAICIGMYFWDCRHLRELDRRREQINQLLHVSPHQAINRHKGNNQTIWDPAQRENILLQAILYKDLELVKALLRLHPRVGLGVTLGFKYRCAYRRKL
jgi:hypothetical protein